MVQQGTVYRYPALLAVFFILFRNNRYAPDKQTINGILTCLLYTSDAADD